MIKQKGESIRIADDAVADGNKQLQSVLQTRPLMHSRLVGPSSLIEMGVERKRKLVQEIEDLKRRRSGCLSEARL